MTKWNDLNQRIIDCQRCPRLIEHCKKIAETKRRAYRDDDYWGKPVPNFGKSQVPLLIVGLAPGAHGANRTGRMFTGDRSGDWLYRAMHRVGLCNQAGSTSVDDGLKLKRCAITAVCHCAPPGNKLEKQEIDNCYSHFDETVRLCRPRVFLALGGIAWKAVVDYAIGNRWLSTPRPKFSHGARVVLNRPSKQSILIGCYHPSQQNTFTGRLTEKMLNRLFEEIRSSMDG